MISWQAYYQLLRLNKPIGTLLLWYPTAWALWTANEGIPNLQLLFLFFIGTVFMRSAGCVLNDIADRKIDKCVARTKLRPLAIGTVSLREALILLVVLLTGALLVLMCLPASCVYWAIAALIISAIYPLCKRFINAPQMVLGIAFSMGIPMAYIASIGVINSSCLVLFAINYAWIVAYDTMYAMTDKKDDLVIGVKSTAIYFGDYDRLVIGLLQFFFHLSWLCWAWEKHFALGFYWVWFFASFFLLYQQQLIGKRNPEDCFAAFLNNNYYGALMWLALILQYH